MEDGRLTHAVVHENAHFGLNRASWRFFGIEDWQVVLLLCCGGGRFLVVSRLHHDTTNTVHGQTEYDCGKIRHRLMGITVGTYFLSLFFATFDRYQSTFTNPISVPSNIAIRVPSQQLA